MMLSKKPPPGSGHRRRRLALWAICVARKNMTNSVEKVVSFADRKKSARVRVGSKSDVNDGIPHWGAARHCEFMHPPMLPFGTCMSPGTFSDFR